MKKVIKLVVITDAPENEVIRLLETNGHCVSHSEVVEPSWEQVWNGFIEANQKYQDENKQAQERHPVYSVALEHPEEMPVISKDKIEQFKEDLEKYSEDSH